MQQSSECNIITPSLIILPPNRCNENSTWWLLMIQMAWNCLSICCRMGHTVRFSLTLCGLEGQAQGSLRKFGKCD